MVSPAASFSAPSNETALDDSYDHGREHGAISARLDSLERSRSIHLKILYLGGGAVVTLLGKWAAAAWLGF